ncbi:MAG: hypothetical protein U1D97_06520, partial [Desulfuromonadales bacterium]|nr:hypothetical protein [Desulfuromonadales bacterium]
QPVGHGLEFCGWRIGSVWVLPLGVSEPRWNWWGLGPSLKKLAFQLFGIETGSKTESVSFFSRRSADFAGIYGYRIIKFRHPSHDQSHSAWSDAGGSLKSLPAVQTRRSNGFGGYSGGLPAGFSFQPGAEQDLMQDLISNVWKTMPLRLPRSGTSRRRNEIQQSFHPAPRLCQPIGHG